MGKTFVGRSEAGPAASFWYDYAPVEQIGMRYLKEVRPVVEGAAVMGYRIAPSVYFTEVLNIDAGHEISKIVEKIAEINVYRPGDLD